jgi:hypothetical protein
MSKAEYDNQQFLHRMLHQLSQPEPEQTWVKRFARRMENELRELGSTDDQLKEK